MTSNKRGLGLITALAAASLAMGAVPASAGPLEDALEALNHCRAYANEPAGDPVVGSGGASCRAVHSNIVGTVCLIYNGVVLGNTCNPLISTSGSASTTTKPTKCLPGLWATQTTVFHAQNENTEVVSDVVLLTCIPPTGG